LALLANCPFYFELSVTVLQELVNLTSSDLYKKQEQEGQDYVIVLTVCQPA
jgi:hypothetical protein